jgi:hypothetical protein
MQERKSEMNHDNTNESVSRSFLGDTVEHRPSFPRASSSNDVTTRAPRRTNMYFREMPSRRSEEGLHISSSSSSTRRSRYSRTLKHHDRLVSHPSGDANKSTPASSSSSRHIGDDVRGRMTSPRSITATPRRTAESGSRRVWWLSCCAPLIHLRWQR